MATLSGGFYIEGPNGWERGPYDTCQEARAQAQEDANTLKANVWIVEHIYEYTDSEGIECFTPDDETEGV